MAAPYTGSNLSKTDSETITGTVDPLSGQPTVFDYAQGNQFSIYFEIFPTTQFFVTRANVPGITLGSATVPTPLIDVPMVGEKLVYDNLEVSFIVDEQLINYQEIHQWMLNIGFPYAHSQFMGTDRPSTSPTRNVVGKQGSAPINELAAVRNDGVGITPDRDLYSRIALNILSSKNNPVLRLEFLECYPVSLSSLEYSVDNSDTDYLTATATFQYMIYKFVPFGS